MNDFYKTLKKDPAYQKVEKALTKGEYPQLLVGLSAVQKAHFIYSFTENLERTSLIITPDEASALKMVEDLKGFSGKDEAVYLPSREVIFYDTEGHSLEYEHARLGALSNILEDSPKYVVASALGATLHTMPPQVLKEQTVTLVAGEEYKLEQLTKHLVSAGYTRQNQVDGVSQFALRGGILDIFPPGKPQPYRIEFWGDEIDTISTFDLLSQRREDSVESLMIIPVRESLISSPEKLVKDINKAMEKLSGSQGKLAREHMEKDIIKLEDTGSLDSGDRYMPLLYKESATVFDYCTDRLHFFCEPVSISDSIKDYQLIEAEDIHLLTTSGRLYKNHSYYDDMADVERIIQNSQSVILDTFTRSLHNIKLAGMTGVTAVQLSPWSGGITLLLEDLHDYTLEDYQVVIMAGTKRAAQGLASSLDDHGITVQQGGSINNLPAGGVAVLEGSLSAGTKYPIAGLVIITHTKVGRSSKRKRRHKKGKTLRRVSDLKVGDYVVHSTHGIGIFGGIVKREIQGVTKDFIKIRYAGTDALFVPVTQLDLVSKYIGGGEGRKIRLNRLNSTEWQKTRGRVKGAVKEMAQELTRLYAKRMNTPGYAFGPDTDWQNQFEQRFPYEETDDQLQAVEDLKKDMEKPMPMDRLLCGDVGFGKTEVAIRGAFKCVMEGKQCAVLVPTTILAWQHFQTFSNRLSGYPVKVELLSRFRTAKEQREVLKKLKTGEVDIVIGTHRILQKDVEFKDLGFAIIDEEQRFGVAHKERFKELKASVDVLTLSATPIPRTLNMALSGIRDISLIEEPPQDRHPVQTYVIEHDQGVILQAISKELRRGGQVFYLHNRISSINRVASDLQEDLPDARIAVAHGRMGEEGLSEIWRQLIEQEIDILVCTTIIETGVDVPNANTLIVDNADNYGLSQLYQLRGRVGRSTRRAYAYFTFKGGKSLSEIATKRLAAIRDFTTFGSGFQIAMRDLEIRGAGNILGGEQHGHLDSVGYDMYIQLLEEAVAEERGEKIEKPTQTAIDIQIDAYIPNEYIHDETQRIDTYKRISAIANQEDALDVTDELIDRFGDPPKAVAGLIDVALVRGQAGTLGIRDIKEINGKIILYPEDFDIEVASQVASNMKGRVLINAGDNPYYSVAIEKGKGPVQAIKDTLNEMSIVS